MESVSTEEVIPDMHISQSLTVNWDDSLFDHVIDPFRQIAISERLNGQIDGRRAGYSEGRDIGRSKAWEIGLELGYVHSFAHRLLKFHQQWQEQMKKSCGGTDSEQTTRKTEQDDRFHKRLKRCLALSQELLSLANQFPDPDSLFHVYDNIADNIDSIQMKCDDASPEHFPALSVDGKIVSNDHESISSETVNDSADLKDVTLSLQRIRAKFKLLLVLLNTNRPFDLKRLLNTNESCDEPRSTNTSIYERRERKNTSRVSAGHHPKDLQKDSDW